MKLRQQCEQLRTVVYVMALEAGKDWQGLCSRAQARIASRNRQHLQSVEPEGEEKPADG